MLDQAGPWLSGPKFFPVTWAEEQAPRAESPLAEPELQHTGSSGSPQGSSFDHPLAVGGSLAVGRPGALRSARFNSLSAEAVSWSPSIEVSARRFGVDPSLVAPEPTNHLELSTCASLSSSRSRVSPSLGQGNVVPSPCSHTQPSACQEGAPLPDVYAISLHTALSASHGDKRQAARDGSGQPRGPTRAGLWASTCRQRTANKEWSTRRSNSLFWRFWRPETCSPTKRLEVVAPTPRGKIVQPEPVRAWECPDTAPPSSAHTPPQPKGAAKRPAKSGSWRKRRQRPGATAVKQLCDLASLLSSKSPDDPQLHHAAIALADWVEEQSLPEEALESQLAWQVLEHCSGTPGPLDLPTLAAFANIANAAHEPGKPQPLSLAIANITKWRPEIIQWFRQTRADCLLAQETHLSLEQEAQAKAALLTAGLHSFWAGATPTNRTKGGLVVATPCFFGGPSAPTEAPVSSLLMALWALQPGVLAGCPIAVALSKVALWPACNAVLNQPAVATADTWVDDLSVDFCGPNPQQVAAKGLRVAKTLFAALEAEGLEVSLKKTAWIASSPAVEAALKKQSKGEATQVSSVAKDLGVANAAGRARRTQAQTKRLRKGSTRGQRLASAPEVGADVHSRRLWVPRRRTPQGPMAPGHHLGLPQVRHRAPHGAQRQHFGAAPGPPPA